MHYFIVTCKLTGESQEVYACDEHALRVGDNVTTDECDDDIACEFCNNEEGAG